ncbi:MAG: hypothetical protein FH753_17915 [Firmicutes bacterium]|nr:hypothetical protein [Bacillota bacterium]
MPGRNGTGPIGEGPMTGRGFGFCSNGKKPFRRGLARRNGFRGRFRVNLTKEEEKQYLNEEKDIIKEQLSNIEKRLTNIENDDNE